MSEESASSRGSDTRGGWLSRLSNCATSAAEYAAAAAIGVIALLVAYEVAARYVFDAPTLWNQDLCIYLLLWAAFLGLAPAERAGEHIRIDLLFSKLPPRARHWIELLTYLAVAGFALLVAWTGAEAALQSYHFGRRSLSLFSVPMWIPQSCVPVGMALMAIESIKRAWRAGAALGGFAS